MSMDVTFEIISDEDFPEVKSWVSVSRGDKTDTYGFKSFSCDLGSVYDYFSKEFFDPISCSARTHLGRAIMKDETPTWYDGVPFKFVKDTIEGQHLLEWVLSKYHIELPLGLESPDIYAGGLDRRLEVDNDGRWECRSNDVPDIPEVDPTKRFLEEVSVSSDAYIYTLKIVDIDTSEEIYYVGRSSQILQRLGKHVSVGGDFREAKDREHTYVYEVVSIRPESEVTEREQYDRVKRDVNCKVCGGY